MTYDPPSIAADQLTYHDTDWQEELIQDIAYWKTYLKQAEQNKRHTRDEKDLRATLDFETRSECDLLKRGAFLYSLDPTTEAMCMSYKLPGQDRVRRWHRAHSQYLIGESGAPTDLFAFILAGGLLEAHNAFFERCIWTHVMCCRRGWPAIEPKQWRCSASKASACSLPRDLDGACKAMDLDIEKDMVGNKLMKKMCKPRQPLKAEVVQWMEENGRTGDWRRQKKHMLAEVTLWHEPEEDIYRLWSYCDTDVESEEALSNSLPELSEHELEIWLMDQHINWRGARFDLDMAEAALEMARQWRVRLNDELNAMTGISSGTKRAEVKAWLLENEDLEIPDTAAQTLEWYIEHQEISGRAKRVMEIVMDVNRTSTRKYNAMLVKGWDVDWRIRDLLMYHGAGTGRWSGKGVQVHNFPSRGLIVDDFVEAAEAIKSRNLDWCVALFGDVMKLVSHALRAAIIPDEDKEFMVADYSAIEARCVLWEADEQDALQVFYKGGDIYCDMATGIYGYKVEKKTHPAERMFGKQAILGLGYGMGFVTFLLTCRKYKIYFSRADVKRIMGVKKLNDTEKWVRSYLCLDGPPANASDDLMRRYKNKLRQAKKVIRRIREARENPRKIVHELALMKHTVDVYRNRYPNVPQMWKDQEQAAIEAIKSWDELAKEAAKEERRGWISTWGSWAADRSGPPPWSTEKFRNSVAGPIIECGKVSWQVLDGWLHCWLPSGRPIRYRSPEIKTVKTSWGESRPGIRYMSVNGTTRKWRRTATYGGKIVENITQAVARDIMANAMLEAHRSGVYETVFTVHDELVCEVGKNKGSIAEFEALMSDIPDWAKGCPVTAEAERLTRYKK